MSGRIRTVKPEWLTDQRLALASMEARVLSVALLLMADDYGRGHGHPSIIGGRAFPGMPVEVAERALRELERSRYVLLYTVDDQQYFAIRNWERHQKVDKPGKPHVPAPRNDPPETPPRLSRESREDVARVSGDVDKSAKPNDSRESRESLAPDLYQDQYQDHDREGTARASAPPPARASVATPQVEPEPETDPGDSQIRVRPVVRDVEPEDFDARLRRFRGLVVGAYGRAWEAERARGPCPGTGRDGGRVDDVARYWARHVEGEAGLVASLAAFFASTDPFVRKVRWAFGSYANDPGRWLEQRSNAPAPAGSYGHDDPDAVWGPMTPELEARIESIGKRGR